MKEEYFYVLKMLIEYFLGVLVIVKLVKGLVKPVHYTAGACCQVYSGPMLLFGLPFTIKIVCVKHSLCCHS